MDYKPGLHILSEFKTKEIHLLEKHLPLKHMLDDLITGLHLQKVGEVYHPFPGGGFTCVVCLTESHISLHTWPEYGMATFDVFLSNFMKDNDELTRKIFKQTLSYFKSEEFTQQEIRR